MDSLPLSLHHAQTIEAALQAWRAELGKDCLSDFFFSNLYLFRSVHDYRFWPGDKPRISGLTYDGQRHVLPLFDLNQTSLAELQDMLAEHGFFYPVSAAVVAQLDARAFDITAHEADADYLYPADHFRHYRGQQLHKKKNQMQQLLARGPVSSRPLNGECVDHAHAVLAQWLCDKHKTEDQADAQACREALHLMQDLKLEGAVYYLDEQPIGFLLAQAINPSLAVMRFAKGVDAFTGVYQFMFHNFCVNRPALQWLNFEQDLGLPNFRQTKRSYNPSHMIQKYRVRLNQFTAQAN
ncbi:phosphatidylglycerol lysyltransferase domain-containing protein [Limnohabitans sp. TS-CS-82]|jgi:hypothetical protein|uniref:phosphatidylglycerol lysyltransferase domain-containing protein n=1 Tax=Limnohabitans sp. TS-CS-82 TaxID=2094193 RepID=UPI0011B0965D|nr:phosphatidylglycerol lysyltransferase domain-containing protein [Limnohabitans sp. TS-CS-82]